MNDEELSHAWTTLHPAGQRRGRIETRVFVWLEARDTPLAAEWLGLFRVAPFATFGLVTVSAVAMAATPLAWLIKLLG